MTTQQIIYLILATIGAGCVGGLAGGLFFIKCITDEIKSTKGGE
jgi:hypothetical protein